MKQLQGCHGRFIHSFCRYFGILVEGKFLQQGSCLIPTSFLCLMSPGRPDPSLASPWVCSQASEMGLDWEARPLPALAAQGWPFPSNSTIPALQSGTCPNTFALNRIAFKSLGLPTHVKGTAGGEKQGKAPTSPARRKKGASS